MVGPEISALILWIYFFILFRCLQPRYAEWQISPRQRNDRPPTWQTEESQKEECAQKRMQNIMMCSVSADCLWQSLRVTALLHISVISGSWPLECAQKHVQNIMMCSVTVDC